MINCKNGPITVPSGITPRTVDHFSCRRRKHSLQASVKSPKTIIYVRMCSVELAFLNRIPECCNLTKSNSPIWDFHQSYVMKVILHFVSRGIPGPCRFHQKIYYFWIHTFRRFLVNGFFCFDEVSRSGLNPCRTGLSTPARYCSGDSDLIRGVNESEQEFHIRGFC